MGRPCRGWVLPGIVLAAALAAARPCEAQVAGAPAAAPEQRVRVQYDAVSGCPDAMGFFLHVRARTSRVRLAEAGEAASTVSVHIEDREGKSHGTLGLPGEGGAEPFVREVEADSCGEVVLALSLVLALAYDPDAIVTFPPGPAPAPAPSSEPAAEPAFPPPPGPPPPSPPLPAEENHLRVGAGADVLVMNGYAPSLGVVPAPFFELGWTRDVGAGFLPRLRAVLLVGLAQEVHVSNPDRAAQLGMVAGRLEACPWSIRLLEHLEAFPCAAFDAGRIEGRGLSSVDGAERRARVWLAASVLGSLRWEFARSLFVEALGGVGIPLRTDRFELTGPQQEVHTVPQYFGQAGLGVGAHFP